MAQKLYEYPSCRMKIHIDAKICPYCRTNKPFGEPDRSKPDSLFEEFMDDGGVGFWTILFGIISVCCFYEGFVEEHSKAWKIIWGLVSLFCWITPISLTIGQIYHGFKDKKPLKLLEAGFFIAILITIFILIKIYLYKS